MFLKVQCRLNAGLQPEVAQSLTLIGGHFPAIFYTEITQNDTEVM